LDTVKAVILAPNQALRLRARDKCIDVNGKTRRAGEEWNVQILGSYLPDVYEEIVTILNAIILTHTKAVHVKSLKTFEDRNGILRKAGTQWLVTRDDCEVFIPDVNEEIIDSNVILQILNSRQYCIIADPVDEEGKSQLLGTKKFMKGPQTFFLKPGENIFSGTREVCILPANQGIWVTAKEAFVDERGKRRRPGDKWVVYGPGEYWPPIEIDVTRYVYAFLPIEPLGLYFFEPGKFIFMILVLLFAYFYGPSYLSR